MVSVFISLLFSVLHEAKIKTKRIMDDLKYMESVFFWEGFVHKEKSNYDHRNAQPLARGQKAKSILKTSLTFLKEFHNKPNHK